jgi:tetratricopeptide (TPR) repeat protein
VTDETWRALLRDASQLRAAGRLPEAIEAYRRLLAANPALPDSWFNLGWLERQARGFEDALLSYQRALDWGIDKPEEVHVNRAAIYSDYLQRPQDAKRELEAAVEKNPAYVPALLSLGNLHEDLGEREPAREAYLGALEVDPTNPRALARLAAVSLSTTLDTELAARLRERIAEPAITNTQRGGLGYALAAMLDAAGEYDEAFAAAVSANEATRAAGGSRARYDRAAHEDLIDRLIAAFPKPVEADEEGPAPPLFICGMYRSGSTLIEQILAGHSAVTAGGELELIPAIVTDVPAYPDPFTAADESIFARAREFYLASLPQHRAVVTDKRPDNFLHIGLIKAMFPAAKIIHSVRNPLDNLLSLYFLHLDDRMSYALDLGDAAHWFGQYRRLMAHWETLYGKDILTVDYDALVRDPEPIVRDVVEFAGLDWEDGLLDFTGGERAVRTASVWQVREPLYTRSSGRWRNYADHLGQARTALAKAGISTDD